MAFKAALLSHRMGILRNKRKRNEENAGKWHSPPAPHVNMPAPAPPRIKAPAPAPPPRGNAPAMAPRVKPWAPAPLRLNEPASAPKVAPAPSPNGCVPPVTPPPPWTRLKRVPPPPPPPTEEDEEPAPPPQDDNLLAPSPSVDAPSPSPLAHAPSPLNKASKGSRARPGGTIHALGVEKTISERFNLPSKEQCRCPSTPPSPIKPSTPPAARGRSPPSPPPPPRRKTPPPPPPREEEVTPTPAPQDRSTSIVDAPSPSALMNAPAPLPIFRPPPPEPHRYPYFNKAAVCRWLCDRRCALAVDEKKKACKDACMTCCDRCNCVLAGPPGFNRETCGPCYTRLFVLVILYNFGCP
ncbi:PREDICTED: gibberellin-regulated protein 14-like [Fragaria vesca subsp. vesca]|uniref:gibberellin-regulated protein 14-like n=1 Tax=Fragaria vesca subsp. vesca TaxID=101020 RepID=UPI0002C311C8|nr:PREDICTED: gibberellin-regulated protein 14-like [Fragaria vesca subsp. vesca]